MPKALYISDLIQVSLCDINSEIGEKLAEKFCTKYGQGKALFCQCDVTDYPQFEGIMSWNDNSKLHCRYPSNNVDEDLVCKHIRILPGPLTVKCYLFLLVK